MALTLHTTLGAVKLELACAEVPKPCFNFLALAGSGFYDGLTLHRNMPGFMAQGGDPAVGGAAQPDAQGGDKYAYCSRLDKGCKGGESIWGGKFEDSFHASLTHNSRGVLSMANNGPGTNGSQFFVTYSAQPHLDNVYTVFGRVIGDMSALDLLEKASMTHPKKKSRPDEPCVIKSVTIHANPFATGEVPSP